VRRLSGALLLWVLGGLAEADEGAALYMKYCAACHDNAVGRTPSRATLKLLTRDRIQQALETGVMRAQGAERTAEERQAIAAFLGNQTVGTEAPPSDRKSVV
jgi:polyvinyl alcohol dehydrogenase (cytochrome)